MFVHVLSHREASNYIALYRIHKYTEKILKLLLQQNRDRVIYKKNVVKKPVHLCMLKIETAKNEYGYIAVS